MIGTNQPRPDARAKADGSLRFTADFTHPDMLHGLVVRAPLPHGRLRRVTRGPGVDWSRIVFATAGDIPGSRFVHMIADDMPFLAWDEVRFKGEPVALVAASTLEEAEAARRAVLVEMDPLPALLTLDELVARHRAGAGGLETLASWSFGHGEVDAALGGAEVVLEDCYTTPHQEQAYLEPNVAVAVPEEGGRMRIEGSLQCPYYVAPAVAGMLGSDLEHVHVLAHPMGGAFGGKEDFPSQLAGQAALLARLSGRPVRLLLSRAEDVAFTTKRHPSWVHVRAGARRDGSLCGVDIEVLFDGGAYVTMSPVVLSRGAIHAPGPYGWPAARVRAVAYRSHTPPNGAFRGFGVPQTIFAIESHMDRLAHACGMAPHELRRRACLKPGDLTATSQRLEESLGGREVLEDALRASGYEEKRRSWGAARLAADDRTARGVGLSLYWHGGGFTGAGEKRIAARAALDFCQDGQAHVRVSSTEMGQGAHTVLCQIAAAELGVPFETVVCDPVDTARVPNSGPTVASRTTMIVGAVVTTCARRGRAQLLDWLAARHGLPREELSLARGRCWHGERELGEFSDLVRQALVEAGASCWSFEEQYQVPPQLRWDEPTHTGDAYAAYSFGCTVAEVEVDRLTLEVRVPRVVTSVEIGRVVNPALAEGQIEGGTLQAVGYALCEEVGVRPDGGLLRDRFQTYILPTSEDAPVIEARLVEVPRVDAGRALRGCSARPSGRLACDSRASPADAGRPLGAKGLGELPMDGTAPAIANALEHALGVRLRDLPLTPEKIAAALERGASGGRGES